MRGVKIGESLFLSLLFMDDVLLFLEGLVREARKMCDILDTYCLASSMALNLVKSSTVLSGVNKVLG